jgi:DNA-binding response OmpR family regulator
VTDDRPIVVVADDDEDILMLMRATLAAAGYEVALARDGNAALSLLRERPAAAVLDIAMPELDGLEVLTRARADQATAELPIILLSARAQESDVARGYELGASKYLRKPFSPRELVAVLDDLLGRQAGL